MYYQIWKDEKNSQWYWHAKSNNHEIIASGEGYTQQAGALHAVSLMKNSGDADIYDAKGNLIV